jgi:hypothetical protein
VKNLMERATGHTGLSEIAVPEDRHEKYLLKNSQRF